MSEINEQIYAATQPRLLETLIDRLVARKRAAMLNILNGIIACARIRTAIDIGATPDHAMSSSNFFARALARNYDVTLLTDQYIDPDRDLDFPTAGVLRDNAAALLGDLNRFDLVVSSATIEHVGSRENQAAMIDSCIKLANRYVFITTPNRWHPFEFHTRLPFIHWLPCRQYRLLLRKIGYGFFAEEKHLNLLDSHTLSSFMRNSATGHHVLGWRIEKIRWLGFVSNLILVIHLNRDSGRQG